MKKTTTLLLTVTLAIGITTQASAQHCTVQKGESIWRIAKEYHLDFGKLLELNKHLKDPHLIHPNQRIITHEDTGQGLTADSSADYRHDEQTTVNESKQAYDESQAQQVLTLVNQERSKRGLKPLQLDNKLGIVATAKAKA